MGWGGESGIAEELREDLFESIGFVELFCLGVVGVGLHKRATDVAKHCDRVGVATAVGGDIGYSIIMVLRPHNSMFSTASSRIPPRTYILLYFTRQIDPTLRQPN